MFKYYTYEIRMCIILAGSMVQDGYKKDLTSKYTTHYLFPLFDNTISIESVYMSYVS